MNRESDTTRRPPDEHQRFARYLRELADVRPQDEADLLFLILRDPDEAMAQSAVVRHLDRRAAHLLTGAEFPSWCRAISVVLGEREFLMHRLRDWKLLRSITVDDPWQPEDLVAASDWFQRTAAQLLTSPAALRLLADRGRTRRVRAAAPRRLTERDR